MTKRKIISTSGASLLHRHPLHFFTAIYKYHWKRIDDKVNGTRSNLRGTYIQMGYFPQGLIRVLPKPLEAIFRLADFANANVTHFELPSKGVEIA